MSQLKIRNGNDWYSVPAGGAGVPSGGSAGDVLVKSSSTNYATEWVSKGITLLWENPDPTLSFADQTLPLDLSGYDMVLIQTRMATSGTERASTLAPIDGKGHGLYASGRQSNTLYTYTRSAKVETTGITFSKGYRETTESNEYMAPTEIYGIKL